MARRKDPRIELRNKESEWILFLNNGFYLYTRCKSCSNMRYCRGQHREAMRCHDCYTGYTEQERVKILEEAAA